MLKSKVRQQNGKRSAKFHLLLCRQLLISSTLKVLITTISECHELCFMPQFEFCDASRWKVTALISGTRDVSKKVQGLLGTSQGPPSHGKNFCAAMRSISAVLTPQVLKEKLHFYVIMQLLSKTPVSVGACLKCIIKKCCPGVPAFWVLAV